MPGVTDVHVFINISISLLALFFTVLFNRRQPFPVTGVRN
jgi:hypothetical protein